jgi:hypothetical protein
VPSVDVCCQIVEIAAIGDLAGLGAFATKGAFNMRPAVRLKREIGVGCSRGLQEYLSAIMTQLRKGFTRKRRALHIQGG